MSNAIGYVYAVSTDPEAEHGPLLGHFIYFGTSDFACTAIFPTSEEAWKANRTDAAYRECTCGKESTPVILHSTYGGGFSWDSMVCLPCGAITGYRNRWEQENEEEKNQPMFGWG